MRIAVPTNDGQTLSEHFGRSEAFAVFEVAGGQIVSQETRPHGAHHAGGPGECQHGGGQGHSHHGIVTALAGCDVVLCGGMGMRAAMALEESGLKVVRVSASGALTDLALAYANGTLPESDAGFCRCSH